MLKPLTMRWVMLVLLSMGLVAPCCCAGEWLGVGVANAAVAGRLAEAPRGCGSCGGTAMPQQAPHTPGDPGHESNSHCDCDQQQVTVAERSESLSAGAVMQEAAPLAALPAHAATVLPPPARRETGPAPHPAETGSLLSFHCCYLC